MKNIVNNAIYFSTAKPRDVKSLVAIGIEAMRESLERIGLFGCDADLQKNTVNVIQPMSFFCAKAIVCGVDGWLAQRFMYLGRCVVPQIVEVSLTFGTRGVNVKPQGEPTWPF